ncbi:MAG: hypothetical protein ACKOWZ_06025 [Sediminibacterium sp.]
MQKQVFLLMLLIFGCYFFASAQVVIRGSHVPFLREGDKTFIVATLSNKSNKPVTGQIHLALINPTNNNPVDGWFQNVFPSQYYSLEAGATQQIQFPIQAAFGYIQMLHYQLEATVLENNKEIVSSSNYTDSFYVYTNRILVADSILIKTYKDTLLKGVFNALLQSPESITHNGLRISYQASTPLDYWKLEMGNKRFTTIGRSGFDTLLLSDFISSDMGKYTLQTNNLGLVNTTQTKIVWSHYNKIEKPVFKNALFSLQKTMQQKIKGRWIDVSENASLHIGDTINVTISIFTPTPFNRIQITENTMGSARLLLSEKLEAKKYDAYFTKEIRNNGLTKQQIQYQYILTNTGVYTTGNTVVNIEAKAAKQSGSGSPIKLFIPATQLRIEE